MQYQLTLQFRGDGLADYDAMIALEEQLANMLGDSAEIDRRILFSFASSFQHCRRFRIRATQCAIQ